jgi:SNF2 family DNA or RNA helicase
LLTLFGHKYIAAHLGTFLAGHKIYLGHVKGPLSVPYFNPHAHGLGGVNRAELIQYGQTAKTVDEVKNQIDAIYDSLVSAEDLPEMDPDPRLCTPLYTHQKQALHFMMKCEHPKLSGDALWKKTGSGYEHLITGEVTKSLPKFHKGGILADDMGLGKTIEVISLLLKSLNESVEWANKAKSNEFADLELLDYDPALMPSKGTLIICPLSTVSNWEEQLQTHLKRGSVSVYVYHGAARCQNPRVLSKFNVVVTTYNILSMEFSKDVKASKKATNGEKEAKIPVAAMSSILHKIRWFRIVLVSL